MGFDAGLALIVGVGAYDTAGWSAPQTVGDAEGVAAALRNAAVAGYPPQRVRIACDSAATTQAVLDELDSLATVAAPQDTVIVFYAGHGLPDSEGQYTLTTHDSSFVGRTHVAPGSGISESVLLEKLSAIQAERVLVILNACFSGFVSASLGPEESTGPPASVPPSDNLVARVLGTGEGRVVLTACRSTQESWFLRASATTIFGQSVTDALLGKAARNLDPVVGVWELYDYVYRTTIAGAAELPGNPLQQPVMSIKELVGAFPVALAGRSAESLGPTRVMAAPPPQTAARVVPAAEVEAAQRAAPGLVLEGVTVGAGAVVSGSVGVNAQGAVFGGNASFSNIAGRDQVQITLQSSPARAATVETADAAVAELSRIRDGVRAFAGVDDPRDDVLRELDDAAKALEDGNHERAVTKLERARYQLVELAPKVEAAAPISESVSALMQRARTLSPRQ